MKLLLLAALLSLAFLDRALCAEGDICYMTGTRIRPSHLILSGINKIQGSIVDNQLYFMGGNYSTVTSGGLNIDTAASLYHLALDSAFPVEGVIPSSDLQADDIDEATIVRASAEDSNGVDSEGALWAGAMVYIPAGRQGMHAHQLWWKKHVTATLSRNTNPPIEAGWLNVYVYDIESHTWWLQRASGDVPLNRISFCTAVSQASDGSAFHITTYGGWSRRDGRAYEDVHILSIPAFQWIDASDVSDSTNSKQDANRRIGRDALCGACQTYRGSEMIVLGGNVRDRGTSTTRGECSTLYAPVRVLYLSTIEWRSDLDTESAYEVPAVVYRALGGNSTGGATTTFPAAGFADDTLASLITQRVAGSTPSSSSSPDTPTSGDQGHPSGSNTGAIVGDVVGGVAGVSLVIALSWLFLRRKRKQTQTQQLSTGETPASIDDKSKTAGLGLQGDATQRNTVSELESPQLRAELQGGNGRHELA
ncbi:hypothetical protein BDW62DRAFT_206745 [Aspergillus aurantiobrunneus]